MTLRTWKVILQLLIVSVNKSSFNIVIISILYFAAIACQTTVKEVEKPVVAGIDESITEDVRYAKYGKTKLSDYGFFKGTLRELNPSEDVLPYALNAPLFSDYASKKRFIYQPTSIKTPYSTGSVLDFPEGTVLIKNFYYKADEIAETENRIIETRLLIHESKGWIALPYIWNKGQTEAFLEITGGDVYLQLAKHGPLKYSVPNMTQCKSCHDKSGKLMPIGPSARQLNRSIDYAAGPMNQMKKLTEIGWLSGMPPMVEVPKMSSYHNPASGNLNDRARAYLDTNCAHCHNSQGPAKNSGLNLTVFENDPYKLGINKKPVAAGRGSGNLLYNIVPGFPEKSILLHRMTVSDPGTRMPETGRSIVHKEGVELIRMWIAEMQ